MRASRIVSLSPLALAAGLALAAPAAGGPATTTWQSPLHGMAFVQVEKRLLDPFVDAEDTAGLPAERVYEPLPPEVTALLGPHAIDYDSFTATYLAPGPARQLAEVVAQYGLVTLTDLDRRVELPWHAFEAGASVGRLPEGFSGPVRPVQGLYLVQFAYPIKQAWLEQLAACGLEQLAYFQQRTVLLRAVNEKAVLACEAGRYASWIGPYLAQDRVAPEVLAEESAEGWHLQFARGTNLDDKVRQLAGALAAEREPFPAAALPAPALLRARGPVAKLRAFALTDADLLSIGQTGEAVLSDERVGQIVAGIHNGIAVTAPGYRTWLQQKNLLPGPSSPIVALFDSGYDDGGPPTAGVVDHHPDFETPEQLLSLTNYTADVAGDTLGHGTMVAGIIAAEATSGATTGGTGVKDSANYLYGEGVAPGTRLVVSKLLGTGSGNNKLGDLTIQSQALAVSRNQPNGSDLALFVNQSWNSQQSLNVSPPPDMPLPVNQYTATAMFMDQHVRDANDFLPGDQPMTIVFSAGNLAWDFPTATVRRDSVSSPATAKNVITVGATANYRPVPDPPDDPDRCREMFGRPPYLDATHIARIASFSGRGRHFGPGTTAQAHTVRVKPDLVAPGVRVASTAPYAFNQYPFLGFPTGCDDFYPKPADTTKWYYTYGIGTSFSAPVVTGAAALTRQWFINAGQVTNPSPAMIKAALIASAESLGTSGLVGSDHRPSPNSGWGRVSLKRLADSTARFYRDNPVVAVNTGETRTWQRPIQSSANDTIIVLVWSDPEAPIVSSSQAALINNLSLAVEEVGTTRFWRGNNFNENKTGNDNGYSYRFTTAGDPILLDAINNVEAVFIPAGTLPAGQSLILRVTGELVTQGPQAFAVFAYNVQP